MARQVISYDDLAPAGVASETVPSNLGGATPLEGNQHPVPSIPAPPSPTIKKRKRDEVDVGKGVCGGVDKKANTDIDNGSGNATNLLSVHAVPSRSQVKKRGRNKRRNGGGSNTGVASSAVSLPVQHWDDPGAQGDGISYDEDAAEFSGATNDLDGGWENGGDVGGALDAEDADGLEEEEEDESRELTHEEIWDDSALVEAWDAANEEYEAMHGKTQRWKRERVHKSPLWYNIPPEKPAASSKKLKNNAERNTNGASSAAERRSDEALIGMDEGVDSSVPLNYETYVPTHDPSLAFPAPPHPPTIPEPTQTQTQNIASHYASMLPTSLQQGSGDGTVSTDLGSFGIAAVSIDEAFSRALGAMYWCGYWTAVYKVQRAHEQGTISTVDNLDVDAAGELVEEEEESTEFVSTQR